ncbi:F-box/kelch-repeat protein At3g23880 [Coffea arabica]|uniref:F-box/kelch-repeat protein At3g23880 n=1 Tax=Coffea arabica TaxID=13443 RepID=A0A6P6WMW8_COFAR|nr:F-box/kelch-repeat protein At3g23880-like [Coffea arabica]
METKSKPEPRQEPHHHHPAKKTKINHPMEEEEQHPSASTSNQDQESSSESMTFPDFPHEILVEILSRLPVKSLVKFKCVSKSWLSLTSNPHFIKAHLRISANKDDFRHHGLIFTVLPPNSHSHLKQCSLRSALNVEMSSIQVIDIDYPMKSPHKSVWVVGSCDGLVCIAIEENDLFLWNPAIRKYKKLPDLAIRLKHGCYIIFGFGYDMLNDDYKVVAIFCVFRGGNDYETEVRVYSLKHDSWMRIENFKGGVPLDDSGKYANGKLHWAASRGFDSNHSWKIVSLDLGNESYGEVERPEYGDGVYDWTFGVLGGCLTVLCDYEWTRVDVWVMKEYGVRDSWSKVVSVPYLDDPEKSRYSFPVCLLKNGEILLVLGSGLVLYNPQSNTFKYRQINGVEEVNMYAESLVSPLFIEESSRVIMSKAAEIRGES